MSQRWRNVTLALFCQIVLFVHMSGAVAQVAVIGIKSLDALRADAKYLAAQSDKPDLAKHMETFFNELAGGKGLLGVDSKRALGVYVDLPAKVGDMPILVAFIPISNGKDFLELVDHLNWKVTR